ncbi:activating signal cointegrator 1 complex subunit 1 isoform X2 [Adelges cooleyi]|nr:activating signal cointegrator 1 complex subunit 1 isoform X2 [Adelges cooleyi]
MDGGQFSLKLEVPDVFYGLIIGRNRETLKSIEYQTRARVKIPGPKDNYLITIKGEQRSQVVAAKYKIESIIKRGRFKQSITHFISLPMVNPTVVENFLTFKEQVLENCGESRGISELLFQDKLRLHLTITCFVLCIQSEIKRATNLMKECEETIIKPMNLKSLDIYVRGLDYMNDDPSEVNVLYAKVNNPELQFLVDKIQIFFQNCDLAKPPRSDHVKLHVTLMNTSYMENASNINIHQNGRDTFDAKKIFELYNDFNFGTVHLTEIHLSQCYTTDSNGYYKFSYVATL